MEPETATVEKPVAASDDKESWKVLGGEFVDEEALVAKSTFAIKPDDLVELTKDILRKGVGTEDPSVLADNFEFCAPVVGPLSKEEYIGALKNFDLLGAFPDMNANYHFIRVDPWEHNRVWWHTRTTGTNTGTLLG